MSDLGQHLRVPAVRFERVLPGPAERAWAHLTECDRLEQWYGEGGVIEPREGGLVNFAGGHIRGVITQWKPHRRLAYTWNVFGPNEIESAYPESYLSFDLAPRGDEIALTLLHLPILERFEAQNAMGWHTFLDLLGATLRGGPVESRRTYMERNAARYGVDPNNLVR